MQRTYSRPLRMTDNENKYRVFLSHTQSDNREQRPDTHAVRNRCWGNWLQDALKNFSVPAEFIGQPNGRGEIIPERIQPIFQDETELPDEANLSAETRQALEQSICLVVICSPRSAQSRQVNEAVRYFKQLGRGQNILPLVIAGEPYASEGNPAGRSPADECFVPALRHPVLPDGTLDLSRRAARHVFVDARHGVEKREILANDQRQAEADLEMARIQLTALVLGIGFNGLWQREQKRHFFDFAEAQRQVRDAQSKILAIQNLPPDVHSQIQEAQNQAREAERQLREFQDKVHDLQTQLEEARSRALASENKVLTAQQLAGEAQSQLEAIRNQTQEAPDATEQLRELQAKVQAAESELAEAQERAIANEDKVAAAEDALREAQDQILEMQQRSPDADRQISAAQNETREAQEQLWELQDKVQAAQIQLAEAQQQALADEGKILAAENLAQALQSELAEARQQLRAAQNQVLEVQQSAQKQMLEAQNLAPDIHEQIQAAQQQVLEAQNQARTAQEQLQELQHQVQTAQNQLAEARNRSLADESKILAAQKLAQETETELKTAQARFRELSDAQNQLEAAHLQAQQEALNKFLAAQSQAREFENQIRSAESQLAEAHRQIHETEGKVLAAQQQTGEAQEKVREMESRTQDARSRIETAQDQVRKIQEQNRAARRLSKVLAILAVLGLLSAGLAWRQRQTADEALAKINPAVVGQFDPASVPLDSERIRQVLQNLAGTEQVRSLDTLAAWLPQSELPGALKSSALILNDQQRSHFQKQLLLRLGEANPLLAMTNAAAIDGKIVNDDGLNDSVSYFQFAVLDNWMKADLSAAFNWVCQLPDVDARQRALEKIIPALAVANPQTTLARLNDLKPAVDGRIYQLLFQGWATNAPLQAVQQWQPLAEPWPPSNWIAATNWNDSLPLPPEILQLRNVTWPWRPVLLNSNFNSPVTVEVLSNTTNDLLQVKSPE